MPSYWAAIARRWVQGLDVQRDELNGQNESSLNIDYVLLDATLLAEDRVIIDAGKVC